MQTSVLYFETRLFDCFSIAWHYLETSCNSTKAHLVFPSTFLSVNLLKSTVAHRIFPLRADKLQRNEEENRYKFSTLLMKIDKLSSRLDAAISIERDANFIEIKIKLIIECIFRMYIHYSKRFEIDRQHWIFLWLFLCNKSDWIYKWEKMEKTGWLNLKMVLHVLCISEMCVCTKKSTCWIDMQPESSLTVNFQQVFDLILTLLMLFSPFSQLMFTESTLESAIKRNFCLLFTALETSSLSSLNYNRSWNIKQKGIHHHFSAILLLMSFYF